MKVIEAYQACLDKTFKVKCGDNLTILKKVDRSSSLDNWYICKSINGSEGVISQDFISIKNKNATVLVNYSSQELSVNKDEEVIIIYQSCGRSWCKNQINDIGWLPTSKISISTLRDYSTFKQLMVIESIKQTSDPLNIIAMLIDVSQNICSLDGLRKAESLLKELNKNKKSLIFNYSIYHYFYSNIFLAKQVLLQPALDIDNWTQPFVASAVIHLRKAIYHESFEDLDPIRKCQIYTNLANQFSSLGRFLEASEYWSKATELNPNFGMANGNLGISLQRYSNLIFDKGHNQLYLMYSINYLKRSLEDTNLDPVVYNEFRKILEKFTPNPINMDYIKINDQPHPYYNDLDKQYRKWVVTNRLFLNPLNDLDTIELACRDVLHLPDMAASIDETIPTYYGMFNQIKQEFCSARFLYYEGINQKETHFSDLHVRLINTIDSPLYGIGIEKIKISFRTLFSVFDKIAYFLNLYFELGIPKNEIKYNTLWNHILFPLPDLSTVEKNKLLMIKKNICFRSLYWLTRDIIHEDGKDGELYRDSLDPYSKELLILRNHLEHKYTKIHDDFWNIDSDKTFKDPNSYSLNEELLINKGLNLLKYIRCSIQYLVFIVKIEEQRKRILGTGDTMTMPLSSMDE